MKKVIRVLLVEDDEDDAILTINHLLENGYEPFYKRAFSLEPLKVLLTNEIWDCVIADYAMPNFTGPEALEEFLKHNLEIPFILLSDTIGEALAVSAMKSGASDYIMKDHLALLSSALDRELREAEIRRQNKEKDILIRNNEIFFRSIIEKSFDIIKLLDSSGNILYASPSNFRLLGYTAQENLGRSIFEILHSEDRAILEKAIKTILEADGNSEFLTVRMKHKDNSWLWFEGTCTNLLKEPTVNAIIVNFQETTKRKQVETELKILNQTLENKINDRTTELQLALEKAKESEYKLQRAFLTCPESVTFTLLETGVYTSVN